MKLQKKYFVILVIVVFMLLIVKNFVIPAVYYGYIPFIQNIVIEDYKPSYEERSQIVYISEQPEAFFFPAESTWYGSIIVDGTNYPVVASFMVGSEDVEIHDFNSSVDFENGKIVVTHTKTTDINPSLFYGETGYTKNGVEFKLIGKWGIESKDHLPRRIVFKKYNKDDVDLESLGFDLSFLSEPELE